MMEIGLDFYPNTTKQKNKTCVDWVLQPNATQQNDKTKFR